MAKSSLTILLEYFETEMSPSDMAKVMCEVVDDYAEYVCSLPSDERPGNCREKLIDLRIFRDTLLKASK